MTTALSPSSGSRMFYLRLIPVVAPIVIMLAALPFANSLGPSSDIAVAVGRGAGLSACALFIFFLLFAAMRPDGWAPKQAVETAETITLWLATSVVVSGVF